jgi:putative NADH-flavin reductase
MKIAIIGATGKAGSFILKEAKERGHDVPAIVRSAAKITDANVNVIEKDIFDLTAADVHSFDVVVNAFGAPAEKEHLHVEAGKKLINVLKEAPDAKLIVVGGAGSLFVDEEKTVRVLETPDFPKEYLPTAQNQGENLLDLQKSEDIQWAFISPSAFFDPEGKKEQVHTNLGKTIFL